MKKILIIIASMLCFGSILLSENVVELGTIDTENNTIEILINTSVDIAGFQFDIEGVDLTGGSGGLAEENGFDVHASGNTALGFSLSGDVIPAGFGVLTILSGTITDDVCLPFVQDVGPEDDTPILADSNGNPYDVIVGGCDCDCMLSTDNNDLSFSLFEAYPNPFNPELNIDIAIENSGNMNVSAYNLNGQLIETIYNGYISANKLYKLQWDASYLSSGIYIIKVDATNTKYSRIVNLLK